MGPEGASHHWAAHGTPTGDRCGASAPGPHGPGREPPSSPAGAIGKSSPNPEPLSPRLHGGGARGMALLGGSVTAVDGGSQHCDVATIRVSAPRTGSPAAWEETGPPGRARPGLTAVRAEPGRPTSVRSPCPGAPGGWGPGCEVLRLPWPPGAAGPRVLTGRHEAGVLRALPGGARHPAVPRLLPQRAQGLPGQPGRPGRRVEEPTG